jgi:hypothetical protein
VTAVVAPVVELTRDELLYAMAGGAQRQLDALLHQRGSHFEHVDSWQHHICGAMAEMAVAKFYGRWWFPVYDDPRAVVADIGEKWQVRSAHRPADSLILRDKDDPRQIYFLVIYNIPRFTLAGWAWGHEVMRDEYLRPAEGDRPRAWFAPQRALRPVTRGQA